MIDHFMCVHYDGSSWCKEKKSRIWENESCDAFSQKLLDLQSDQVSLRPKPGTFMSSNVLRDRDRKRGKVRGSTLTMKEGCNAE